MPRPPNDNEKPQPAAKPTTSRRARRTSTPHRFNPATYARLWSQCPPGHRQLTETLLRYKPLEMLRYLIKSGLDDLVTKEELKVICTWCYDVLMYWDICED
jgi:hypothetical protein